MEVMDPKKAAADEYKELKGEEVGGVGSSVLGWVLWGFTIAVVIIGMMWYIKVKLLK